MPTDSVWAWTFYSAAELKSALEEYTEYVMAQGAPPDGGDPDSSKKDRTYRIYCQNKQIDRHMAELDDIKVWRLLESYYRLGHWGEFRGWVETSRYCGRPRPKCPGAVRCRVGGDDRLDLKTCSVSTDCRALREQFLSDLSRAIDGLFHAMESAASVRNTRSTPGVDKRVAVCYK